VRETGRTLFGDNCAVCHGREAKGGRGFPNLTTPRGCGADRRGDRRDHPVGINSPIRRPRLADAGLRPRRHAERDEIENVVAYVLSLSNGAGKARPPDRGGQGGVRANCAACHGRRPRAIPMSARPT
jgi:cytochrome c oxidase cbb3-type subunit 3